MKQLSLTDTQNLVSKLVRSIGERATARKLTEMGYRSPEGKEVRQGHVSRIQRGSWTCLQAPDTSPEEVISALASTPEAAYSIGEPYPEHCIESSTALAPPSKKTTTDPEPGPREVRRQLRQELETQEELRKEREENSPPEVPRTSDYSHREFSHVEKSARVSGIFNRRAPVEFDETKEDFFGLPRLQRQPQKVVTKPHETKSYAKLSMNAMEPYTLQSKRNREERD